MAYLRLKVNFVIHFQLRAKYHAYSHFANKLINEPLITEPSKTFYVENNAPSQCTKSRKHIQFHAFFAFKYDIFNGYAHF